jgi:hypothetical protein
MTQNKRSWIAYMMRMVRPTPGLESACQEMLGGMYDQAFEHGYDQATLDKAIIEQEDDR